MRLISINIASVDSTVLKSDVISTRLASTALLISLALCAIAREAKLIKTVPIQSAQEALLGFGPLTYYIVFMFLCDLCVFAASALNANCRVLHMRISHLMSCCKLKSGVSQLNAHPAITLLHCRSRSTPDGLAVLIF